MLAKLSPAIDWFKYLKWFLISCTEEELVDCSNTALQFLGHSSCLLCLQLPGDLINLRVWFWPPVKDKNMSYIIWRISNLQISLRVAETNARLSIDLDWEFWELKKWNMNISRHTLLPQKTCERTRTCAKNILPDLPKLLLGPSPPSSPTGPLHTHPFFKKKSFFASLAAFQYSGIFYRSNKWTQLLCTKICTRIIILSCCLLL